MRARPSSEQSRSSELKLSTYTCIVLNVLENFLRLWCIHDYLIGAQARSVRKGDISMQHYITESLVSAYRQQGCFIRDHCCILDILFAVSYPLWVAVAVTGNIVQLLYELKHTVHWNSITESLVTAHCQHECSIRECWHGVNLKMPRRSTIAAISFSLIHPLTRLLLPFHFVRKLLLTGNICSTLRLHSGQLQTVSEVLLLDIASNDVGSEEGWLCNGQRSRFMHMCSLKCIACSLCFVMTNTYTNKCTRSA